MEVPSKSKNRVTILSYNSTPGQITEENSNLKRFMHLMFMTVLYIIAKIMESAQVLLNICIEKEDVVYVYTQRMSHYSAIN